MTNPYRSLVSPATLPETYAVGDSSTGAEFKAAAGGRKFACIKRRDVLALAAGAFAWTSTSYAQKRATATIGYLCPESSGLFASRLKAFHQGLGELGFVDNRNVAIEYRWAEGQY